MYHFIGIGGIGMSGLARMLLSRGKQVSGSDIAASSVTEALEKAGASISIGHHEQNIHAQATVIFSSDIPQTNPELVAAKKYQCQLLHRSDLLHELMGAQQVLAVTGTHGKTTTASLLVHVLKSAGLEPAFAVGGMLLEHHTNASTGAGKHFIVEADESDGTFLRYSPSAAIVTNIDTDHLSHYGSMEKLVAAFGTFIDKVKTPELLFYCADDPYLSNMSFVGTSYGFSENAQLRVSNLSQQGWSLFFDIHFQGRVYLNIEVKLAGQHNALNAAAVFGLALALGVSEEKIRHGLATFYGVKRRMEKKGEIGEVIGEVLIYDDYAHHPTELRATLQALRAAVHERRIVAVFQPHRYSRMKHVLHEFKKSFNVADLLIVTDLYTAGETPIPAVSTESIIEAIKKESTTPVHYISRTQLTGELSALIRPHDVVITLGAGDITKVGDELITRLQEKNVSRYRVGVLFGGMNCEHEVSCISAKTIISNLRQDIYDVRLFVIGLDGKFRRANDNLKPIQGKDKETSGVISEEIFRELAECDVFVPVLHGPFGEDGIVQGFLEVLRKPYVGCDSRSAAVAMDKALMKGIAERHGIATAPFVGFDCHEWTEKKTQLLQHITQTLPFPLFVKPTHMGSSVGISKVQSMQELEVAIDRAFSYDTHVIVEQGLQVREIEFAVLGNSFGNSRLQILPPGEILTNGEFYHYEAKYGENSFSATPKAILPDDKIKEGCMLAEKIYRAAACQGLARVDFFLDASGTYWFNEINPFPGMTPNSLYPKIWKEKMTLDKLVDQFIILALHRFSQQEKIFSFSSQHLSRS